MYTFIRGTIDEVFFDGVSVDVNGVGYFIYLSAQYLSHLNQGQEVKIFTTLIHREDTMKLYGFQSKEERQLFNLLNSVSGVGTKTAMGILSAFNISDIISFIYSNNTQKLSKAPGIGPKTAQRIILELKEKISGLKTEIGPGNSDIKADKAMTEQYEETEATLLALGYTSAEINQAVRWLNENRPNLIKSDDMIREALQLLST